LIMTVQIFVRGNRVQKVNNDMVSATTINATGTIVYYLDGAQAASYKMKEVFTTAAGDNHWATATAASASIEALGGYPNPSPETLAKLPTGW